ncbi:hypothetical protein F4819DRAFT_420819 [Hypoxylon fuscum]|nr:hypothetical protein F4819DRAFT_420819 [Hypoxylon fuscum]
MAYQAQITQQFHDHTYSHLRINDHTLDDQLPCSLQNRIEKSHIRWVPTTTLGALKVFPPELIQEILIQLDIRTFINFRYVNKRAAQLADSIPQYKDISTHAQNALQGILCIGTGQWMTLRTLYDKLCTYRCDHCGDFGGYLYLLTCKRLCFLCLIHKRPYFPLLRTHARFMFGLNHQTVEALPRMRVLPGLYSPSRKKATPLVLVDYESALNAGISLHGSLSNMQQYVEHKKAQDDQAYAEKVAAARLRGSIRQPHRSVTEAFDAHAFNPLRFVVIVRVPWFNTALREEDWGSYCIGCEDSSEPPLHYRRKFTVTSFDDHLRQCGRIIDGKHHSETS